MATPRSTQGPHVDKLARKNMKWTTKQDDMFIHSLLQQCKDRNTIPGGFTAHGWNEITKKMKKHFGSDFSKDKLKNRFKTYKKWYSGTKTMLNLNGFSWDEDKRMIIADNGVWDKYIMAHPAAALYRSKSLPDYFQLAKIFGDSIVGDQEGFISNESLTLPPIGDAVEGENQIEKPIAQDGVAEDIICTSNRCNAVSAESSHQKNRRRSVEDAMVESMSRVADALESLADSHNAVIRMKKCWEALDSLDIEDNLKLKALRILRVEINAATFLALPQDVRKRWLLLELSMWPPDV